MPPEVLPVNGDKPRSGYRERNSTADRTLDILGMFHPGRLRISAQHVADELGVARSTAYRYLQTLSAEGYIEENPDGGFRLGMKVFELARIARQSYGVSAVAIPILQNLAATTGETALLTRRSGDNVICLEREESTRHRLRLSYERGSSLALNAGASALVLLAWEEPDVVEAILSRAQLPQFTENTVTDPQKLQQRLAAIREQGYAVTQGELDPGALGVAAPVRDEYHRVVAGLSVIAPGQRAPQTRIAELVDLVNAAAERLGSQLALISQ
jgi:DNA-binding IclR family transcriptional regulator